MRKLLLLFFICCVVSVLILKIPVAVGSDDSLQKYETSEKEFERVEIGDKIIYFHQRMIDDAIVEKDFINYQFDKDTEELIDKKIHWRDDLPEHLPPIITKGQLAFGAEGEVQSTDLYIISPESVVFPLEPTPENPCWIVRSIKDDHLIITINDAVTGDFLGYGVPPPQVTTGFSLSGPMFWNPCSSTWTSWYQNARDWFQTMGYPTEAVVWPTEMKVKSHIQSTETAMFYELAHGGSYYFGSACSGGTSSESTTSAEVNNWIAGYTKMPFTFLGSCDGMCSTGSGTFSYEFRKGSTTDTATVGYCGMSADYCSTCWVYSISWQTALFGYMNDGDTVKQAYDDAMADYPTCLPTEGACMRFAGDEDFVAVPVVTRTFTDADNDGVPDGADNCPNTPNGPALGTCYSWSGMVSSCTGDNDCGGSPGSCGMDQKDTDGDIIGDVCDLCTDLDSDEYGIEGLDNSGCTYTEYDCDDSPNGEDGVPGTPDDGANINPGADDKICDNLDNDCDDTIDEDYVSNASCFLPGVCAASNQGSTCAAGTETACQTGSPSGISESICNGDDDDCDDTTDEDYVSNASCFLPGVCAASNQGSTCAAGTETACQTGSPTENPETTCGDTQDNDCDGLTDCVDDDCGCDLVGYWNFDEGSGTDVADSSGRNNDGIVSGTEYWVDNGDCVYALYFDGDDNVEIDNPNDFILESWTLAAWVNSKGLLPGQNSYAIIGKPDDSNGKYNFSLGANSLGQVCSQYETCESEEDHKVCSTYEFGTWFHIVSTRDNSSGEHTLYINGEIVASDTSSDTPCQNGERLRIGDRRSGVDDSFYGTIDEGRIYNRALSDSEIEDLYNNECPPDRDSDNDGIPNDADNCLYTANGPNLGTCSPDSDIPAQCTHDSTCECQPSGNCSTDQEDTDEDGVGDVCDNCPEFSNTNQNDSDTDDVGDTCDNCREVSNSDQLDSNTNCPEPPYSSDPLCGDACEIPCGNNVIEESEVCDGTDLGGETCETQGYDAGVLYCLSDCSGFDASECIGDSDGDSVADDEDNCPTTPNGPAGGSCYNYSTQEVWGECLNHGSCRENSGEWWKWCDTFQGDQDSDGIGDVCEDCPLDSRFQKTTLAVGIEYYTDRDYVITGVPASLLGLEMIKTPNDEKNATDASDYLTFNMPFSGVVFVAYDRRVTSRPNWMSGFNYAYVEITTSDTAQGYMNVFYKPYSAGECINLGGNKAPGFSGDTVSNYIVFY